MKVQSFQYMRTLYSDNREIEPDELEERNKLLSKYKYSVIVEGEDMEFDNLQKWIKQNSGSSSVEYIYYSKTDYDYRFAEFFMSQRILEEKLRLAVPNIYTTYPDSYPPRKICKSDGSKIVVDYRPENKDAIVYPPDAKS